MTYAEYLRSQGATDEDIKVLDTPLARKAYESMESRLAAEQGKLDTYQKQVDEYYKTTGATAKKLENEAIVAKAEAARAKTALMAAQDQGLLDVAKDLGYTPDDPAAKAAADRAAADRARDYYTRDEVKGVLESAGDGLAALTDAIAEHGMSFPTVPFNAREIRRLGSRRQQVLLPVLGREIQRAQGARRIRRQGKGSLRGPSPQGRRRRRAREVRFRIREPCDPPRRAFHRVHHHSQVRRRHRAATLGAVQRQRQRRACAQGNRKLYQAARWGNTLRISHVG